VAPAEPLPRGNPPTLLHGDFWPGNTSWQEGQLAAVIDWKDAKVGDPLIDLAISRSDIVWIFGTEAMDAFTHHYQSLVAIDDTNRPCWDLCAALRFIRWTGGNLAEVAASFASLGRQDITERTIRGKYRFFVTQALRRLTDHP
jgi:aminoglycoside phosphotransferase (APT) family kinase protein